MVPAKLGKVYKPYSYWLNFFIEETLYDLLIYDYGWDPSAGSAFCHALKLVIFLKAMVTDWNIDNFTSEIGWQKVIAYCNMCVFLFSKHALGKDGVMDR